MINLLECGLVARAWAGRTSRQLVLGLNLARTCLVTIALQIDTKQPLSKTLTCPWGLPTTLLEMPPRSDALLLRNCRVLDTVEGKAQCKLISPLLPALGHAALPLPPRCQPSTLVLCLHASLAANIAWPQACATSTNGLTF
jgi:hypothetical protein